MRRTALLLTLLSFGCNVAQPRTVTVTANVVTVTPIVSRSHIVLKLEQ